MRTKTPEQFEFFSVIYSADVCVSFFLKKDREAADWGTTCTYRIRDSSLGDFFTYTYVVKVCFSLSQSLIDHFFQNKIESKARRIGKKHVIFSASSSSTSLLR
jgi:hypothetical protein